MSMSAIYYYRAFILVAIINLGGVWRDADATEQAGNKLLDTQIPQFECTNLPVSEAIMSLAGRCAFPINSVIDNVDEPKVTVSARQQDCEAILRQIIRPLDSYEIIAASGAVLVCPQHIILNRTFPLNQPLPEFKVEFLSSEKKTNTSYGCQLDAVTASSRNVALPFLPLKWTKPNCDSFPCVRRYKDRTLLDVLTELSVELHRSWACGQVNPSYVKERNAEWKNEGHSTYWPNENMPFYHVSWGDQGAFHGLQRTNGVVSAAGK